MKRREEDERGYESRKERGWRDDERGRREGESEEMATVVILPAPILISECCTRPATLFKIHQIAETSRSETKQQDRKRRADSAVR